MNSAQRKRQKLSEMRSVDKQVVNFDNAEIRIQDFVNARQAEIKALEKVITNSVSMVGQRVFQTLPKHLRRRASSHNIKRLPFGLRKYAQNQLEKDGDSVPIVTKKKKASWKLRYKSKTKLKYLDTHIWHAKRMKMVTMWGHRLADRPTEKSYHRLYRYAQTKSKLHDMSYCKTMLIKGTKENI